MQGENYSIFQASQARREKSASTMMLDMSLNNPNSVVSPKHFEANSSRKLEDKSRAHS